ncbi:MAG: response regulator, partial [Saprospiraceae bacterium]|nr:response regulator [Saprospiraceae bacterium]
GITSGMMARDSSNWIWVASWVGLSKFNIDRQEIINYFPDSKNPKSIPGISVPFVFIDHSSTVWVSVWSRGLYQYQPRTDDFAYLQLPVPNEKGYNTRAIHQDSHEDILLATDSHLYLMDSNYEVKKVHRYKGINSFWSDTKNGIWIGSEHGLFLMTSQDSIKDLTDEIGLTGFRIKSILGDDSGNLWLGTQKGLVRYNINGHFHHIFTIDDGLTGNIYLPACLKAKKGELYFGLSDGGVLRFHPDSIRLNDNIPKIVLTSFKNQKQKIKLRNISNLDTENNDKNIYEDLELKWFQNDLSISFVALNFTSPQKNQYRYKLENYDSDWNNTDQNNNNANYTNLDPGSYTFHVIGSNSDGVWNEEGVKINISILPPWYWNTYSKISLLILFGVALWFIRRYEKNREKLRYALQLEKVRSEELEEVDKLKTQFFSNISHELKTPITLITGPVKELIKQNRKEDKRYLHIIQGNAERLRSLVDQLLDLARIDARKLSLQTREIDFISFCRKIFNFYIPAAEEKDIRYIFRSSLLTLPLFFDPDKMEKIVNNLLSNAFKFTPRGKEIEMHIECDNAQVQLSVKDSGTGISENDLPKIFDRFFQADISHSRAFEGTGIGLSLAKELTELHHGRIKAESTLNRGTCIEIILPIGKEHLSPEEIVADDTGVSLSTSRVGHYGKSTLADLNPLPSSHLPTVLIVEDNEDMRGYLKLLLAKKYQILESDNGELALQVARDVIPDLIVSDVMMPKMTGFDFCEQIKADMLTCHIPILLLTVKS